jgi:dephospho-CoA kinase
VLDADKTAHEALENCAMRVRMAFGDGVAGSDGRIDRRVLGAIVFASEEKRRLLESITYPEINRLTEEWRERNEGGEAGRICALNAAVLHKSSCFNRLAAIVIVRSPYLVRFWRALRRDPVSFGAVFRRFSSQKYFTSQYLKSNSDIYYIDNWIFWTRGSPDRLKKRVNEVLDLIAAKAPANEVRVENAERTLC